MIMPVFATHDNQGTTFQGRIPPVEKAWQGRRGEKEKRTQNGRRGGLALTAVARGRQAAMT